MDQEVAERAAACVAWLVDTLDIKQLAFAGTTLGEEWHVEGRHIKRMGPDGVLLRSLTITERFRALQQPQSFGIAKFLEDGRFRGTVFGLGDSASHFLQVEALGRLSIHQKGLVAELDAVMQEARLRVETLLAPRCRKLFRLRPTHCWFSMDFAQSLAHEARDAGVDLSRFPYLHLLGRFAGSWRMLNLKIAEAFPEIETVVQRLDLWLARAESEELRALRNACESPQSRSDATTQCLRGYALALRAKQLAEQYRLQPTDLPHIREAIEAYDSLQLFIAEGLTHVDREAQVLFRVTCARLVPESAAETKRLLDAIEVLQMVRSLCALELTYRSFLDVLAADVTMERYLDALSMIQVGFTLEAGLLKMCMKLAKDFYYSGIQRSRRMSELVTDIARKPRARAGSVLLIETEGFHLDPFQEELADHPLGYYSVWPRYYSKEGGEDLEKLARGAKAFYNYMAQNWQQQFLPRQSSSAPDGGPFERR
jgi:hypothetical protein